MDLQEGLRLVMAIALVVVCTAGWVLYGDDDDFPDC